MKDPKEQYEAPEIIYEGEITTRAGSPSSAPGESIDPIDEVFGNAQ